MPPDFTPTPAQPSSDAEPGSYLTGAPADKPADAPIEYKFETPEGVELDADQMADFEATAKEAKLDQASAQKLLNMAIKREQARAEAFTAQVKSWADEVAADPELGKSENLAAARRAVDMFGDDAFKSVLNSTGLGNHPAIVRAFIKMGKAISEDSIVKGRPGSAPKTTEEILYPNQA